MRKMSTKARMELKSFIISILKNAVGWEYAKQIANSRRENADGVQFGPTFMDEVIDDVIECSAWEDTGDYNDDDVRLAIGRVMLRMFEMKNEV